MKFLLVIIISSFQLAYGVNCEWWQVKVKRHKVEAHQRKGNPVSAHPRREHCRERWNGADIFIKQFQDGDAPNWKNKESFKHWNIKEKKLVLGLLGSLPKWLDISDYKYYRAAKSIYTKNPASSDVISKSIVIYDQFFNSADQKSIINHEAAHNLYQNLSASDLTKFGELAGWEIQIIDRKIYKMPPKKLLLPDSNVDQEEDFSNHIEVYIKDQSRLKKLNPKIFQFFQERYPI